MNHLSTICRSWLPRTGSRCQQATVWDDGFFKLREILDVRILTNLSEKVGTKLCLSLDSSFPIKLLHVFENQQFVELKSQQDGFDIDSLTVSCRNCPWGVTFNATKDRSLKAVSSEYLECSKTVTAPLVVTSVGFFHCIHRTIEVSGSICCYSYVQQMFCTFQVACPIFPYISWKLR